MPPAPLSPIRPALVILAVCLWTVAAWTLASPGRLDRYGTPKAVDFSQFYVYGRLVSTGQGSAIFDRARWESVLTDVWGGPGPAYVPLYPPTIGFLFAPLAPLSFTQAAIVWTVLSLTLAAGAIWLLLRACPRLARDPITLGLLAAAWPALQQLLLVGQVSALWLLSVSLSLWAFRSARPVVAGVALGLLGLKPSLLPFAIVVLAGAGQWRALAGMTLSLAGQAAIVWIAYGPAPWAAYADVVADLVGHPERYEPSLWQAHGLLNALVLLMGRGWVALGIYGLISLSLVVVTVRRWRASPSPGGDPIACSIFVLGLLITSPHLYVYRPSDHGCGAAPDFGVVSRATGVAARGDHHTASRRQLRAAVVRPARGVVHARAVVRGGVPRVVHRAGANRNRLQPPEPRTS